MCKQKPNLRFEKDDAAWVGRLTRNSRSEMMRESIKSGIHVPDFRRCGAETVGAK